MARHRARTPLAEVLRDALRRPRDAPPATTAARENTRVEAGAAPPPAGEAPTERIERVLLEELPAEPRAVELHYPDGEQLPAGWAYGGPAGARQRWVALVPASARLVNGMVIRVERDTVLAVAVRDGP